MMLKYEIHNSNEIESKNEFPTDMNIHKQQIGCGEKIDHLTLRYMDFARVLT